MRVLVAGDDAALRGAVAGELVVPYWSTCRKYWDGECTCGAEWLGVSSRKPLVRAVVVEWDDDPRDVIAETVQAVLEAGNWQPTSEAGREAADYALEIASDFEVGDVLVRWTTEDGKEFVGLADEHAA